MAAPDRRADLLENYKGRGGKKQDGTIRPNLQLGVISMTKINEQLVPLASTLKQWKALKADSKQKKSFMDRMISHIKNIFAILMKNQEYIRERPEALRLLCRFSLIIMDTEELKNKFTTDLEFLHNYLASTDVNDRYLPREVEEPVAGPSKPASISVAFNPFANKEEELPE